MTTGALRPPPQMNINDDDDDTDLIQHGQQDEQPPRPLPPNSTSLLPNDTVMHHHNPSTTTIPTSTTETTVTAPLHPLPTTTTTGGLGHVYQAEIEARRRQRQERMARYASRLAELKQEDNIKVPRSTYPNDDNDDEYDDGIPMVDTARSLDSSVDYGSSGIGRGVVTSSRPYRTTTTTTNTTATTNHQYLNATTTTNDNNNNNIAATHIAMSRSWEDDILHSLSRSNYHNHPPGGVDPVHVAASNPGSVSTLSNTARPDDEIQRGVERVLLAILERANSRGRTAMEGRLLERHHSVISEPLKVPPVAGDEEKKSNDEKNSDDVLVLAMSELLGPSAITSTAALNGENENPSSNLPTQTSNGELFNGFLNSTQVAASTTKPMTTMMNTRNATLSPELPIRPIETFTSHNMDDGGDEVDDDVVDNPSILSEYNHEDEDEDEDDVTDERLDDDDDEGSDEDDSRTYDDDEEDLSRSDDYDSNAGSESYEKRVLGPLNKKSGGTTGVVLDDYSSASSASYDDEEEDDEPIAAPQTSSLLESLSAAVSRVTGIAKVDDNDHSGRSAKGDKYAMDDIESNEESDASTDSEANDLMQSLCAHLLPVPVDRTRSILDDVPEWDESNPDEAGYRIVRLTSFQLRSIEKEYERFMSSLSKKSQLILSPKVGIDDSAFELDLQAAEKLLEEEENKLKSAESQQSIYSAKSSVGSVIPKPVASTAIESHEMKKEADESECLTCFPGVKPAGNGEMGELEYFTLPIIFKSHVTGFEPTKDIILEPGNVVAGQYLVEGVLGSAAFSTAYKCIDLSSEEDSSGCQDFVCLKVIKNTKDFFDQSLDEIKILELLRQTGKCNEKFIVEMKTFFYHREHLIIVTELLRQNLFEFGKFILDSGEEPYFTLPRLSYIARQCFIALEFVHGMGLVHSDVKPENILLASYSRAQAKLIDFGSSCYLTDRQSSYIQSRSYRAPEVVLGLPYDGRIDIWSIGCVIAEMFTGEVTFQNDSVVSMLSRIESICGPFPRHMVAQGRQSARFFAKCGLLFEKVVNDTSDNTDHSNSVSDESSSDDQDENQKRVYIDIFQPKKTTLAARLGFAPNLMDKFDNRAQLGADELKQALFCDLIRKLLTIDPELRLTATEALNHPAMLYAATLSESDVKYPSS